MFIDYYVLFEIDQDASIQEIKKAFRIKAIFWHPDRNPGKDTTKEMQLINEAYLILKDDEARKRYDIEYIRFSSFRQQKKEETQNEHSKTNKESTKNTKEPFKEKQESYEYMDYSIFDETLKHWMKNAKKQALEMAIETIKEFGNIASVGIKESAKGVLQGLRIQVLIGILILFIFSISKSCN